MQKLPALSSEIVLSVRRATVASVSAVMRVEVTGDVGYLFFLEGDIVHAATMDLEGEAAVTTIFGWSEGQLAWCERRWPRERSVFRSWSQLADSAAPTTTPPDDEPQTAPSAPPAVHLPSSLGLRQTIGRAEFKNALRLTASGHVSDTRGSTAHLKPILLSSLTLGDSLGQAFGLGPLIAAEATASGFHRLVARSAEDAAAGEIGDGYTLRLARAFLKL